MKAGPSMTLILEPKSRRTSRASALCSTKFEAIHTAGFESAFGAVTVRELLEDWHQSGLKSVQIPGWVEKLRKAAFEADSLGEVPVEFRNRRELPDVAAGVVPVLCAILDYLGGCCGSDGVVMFVFPDKTP